MPINLHVAAVDICLAPRKRQKNNKQARLKQCRAQKSHPDDQTAHSLRFHRDWYMAYIPSTSSGCGEHKPSLTYSVITVSS